MIKCALSLFLTIMCSLLNSCGSSNLFSQVANQTSDEALLQDAQKKIDKMDYSGAITVLNTKLSATYKKRVSVKEMLIGAYAGQCGLSFVTMVNGLSSASGGIFSIAMASFGGLAVDPDSCDLAVAVLQGLGAASERTANQNLYGAILGLTKLGVNLHQTLDTNPDDGAVDSGVSTAVCDKTPTTLTAGKLTDAQVNKVIVGVGLIFENISALSAGLGATNAAVVALESAKTQCESAPLGDPDDPGGTGSCTIIDEGSVTAIMRRLFRKMLSSSALGFGSCDIKTLGSCCPGLVP